MGGVLEVCGEFIPLSKLIGLLYLFCLPLLSILFLKTKRNDLARPVMGIIFLVSEMFIKTLLLTDYSNMEAIVTCGSNTMLPW